MRMSDPAPAKALHERVAQVLAREVAPALQMDGTDLELLDVRDGVARVRLRGGCGGCPSSIMADIMGVEEELRRRGPEVEYIEAVP
jgi:Fe-S cluster biogenesis protein NfuA